MSDLRITQDERMTPLWMKLEKHYQARLVDLRQRNDQPKTDTETAFLRGQISEVKRLLAPPQDSPPT